MISGALLQAFFATIFLGTKKNTDAPREEAFSIPLKSVDVVRHTQTHWDIQQEHKIDDYWNVHSERTLSKLRPGWMIFDQKDGRLSTRSAARRLKGITYHLCSQYRRLRIPNMPHQ